MLQLQLDEYAQKLDQRVDSVSQLFGTVPPGALVCAVCCLRALQCSWLSARCRYLKTRLDWVAQ